MQELQIIVVDQTMLCQVMCLLFRGLAREMHCFGDLGRMSQLSCR